MPDNTNFRDTQAQAAGGTSDSTSSFTGGNARVAGASFAKVDRVAVRVRLRPPVRVTGGGVDLRFGEVPNPYYTRAHEGRADNPRTISVAWNSNESPLVRLKTMGTIDQRQAAAGHVVRMLYEKLSAGRGSPSFIQERVDGGSAPDVFTEGRVSASRQLKRIAADLGDQRYRLLITICGEGRSLNDTARMLQVRKTTVRAVLLEALDLAAEHLGLGKPKRDA